ncbi:MAG: hypothetical protein AAB946_01295 [Patescibacteria group bacterium]
MRFLKLGLGLIFLISLASLGAIVVFINPYKTGKMSYALFSIVVFLGIFSVLSLAGVLARRKFISDANADRILKMAFRQSALLSLALTSYVWLGHFRLFKVWTAIPILVLIVGVEYYFLTRRYNLKNEN